MILEDVFDLIKFRIPYPFCWKCAKWRDQASAAKARRKDEPWIDCRRNWCGADEASGRWQPVTYCPEINQFNVQYQQFRFFEKGLSQVGTQMIPSL